MTADVDALYQRGGESWGNRGAQAEGETVGADGCLCAGQGRAPGGTVHAGGIVPNKLSIFAKTEEIPIRVADDKFGSTPGHFTERTKNLNVLRAAMCVQIVDVYYADVRI